MLIVLVLPGCRSQEMIPDELPFAAIDTPAPTLEEYRIQPRDQLDVKFFYSPELNESVVVRPDGKISLQLIGEIKAAGLAPEKLQVVLQQEYSKHLRDPAVTVIMRNFSNQEVFVDGEVGHPGLVELMPGLTAWQAIIKAGGFKETATRESVIIIRHGDRNQPVPYSLNLKSEVLNDPNVLFKLKPHDVIYVPKTAIAEADKFVEQYIEKLLLFKGWYFNLNPISPVR
jgi:polysaccharide export outer membrane protein